MVANLHNFGYLVKISDDQGGSILAKGNYGCIDIDFLVKKFTQDRVFEVSVYAQTPLGMARSTVLKRNFNPHVLKPFQIKERVLRMISEAVYEAEILFGLIETAVIALGLEYSHEWYKRDLEYSGLGGSKSRYEWQAQGDKLVLFYSRTGVPKGVDGSSCPKTPMRVVQFERMGEDYKFSLVAGPAYSRADNYEEQRALLDQFQYATS